MKDSTLLSIVAILALTALEIAAIATDHDGAYFMPVVAAISALAGYKMHAYKEEITGHGETEQKTEQPE